MVVVTRSARPEIAELPRIDLDLSAFVDAKPGTHVFNVPNLVDPKNVPGEVFIVAFSDGFESKEAQASALVSAIVSFFPQLGRFMQRLTIFDWIDVLNAWRDASKEGMPVAPKG